MSLHTVHDLLEDQLKDLYNAENQLLKALPELAEKASTASLKDAFTAHKRETEGHILRLERVAEILGVDALTGKTCQAMKGLVAEGSEVLRESGQGPLIDLALIAAARRVEHYEYAAYCTLALTAKTLGLTEAAELLAQTKAEESAADDKLVAIAKNEVIESAAHAGAPL